MAMTIAEALSTLNTLKSKIARAQAATTASTTHDEDAEPEYVYADELAARNALDDQIVKLKALIQVTNATTQVVYGDQTLSISELILRNGKIRSDIAFYTELLNASTASVHSYRGRSKDEVKKVMAPGYDKKALRAQVEDLEKQKDALSAFLSSTNFKTNLVGV